MNNDNSFTMKEETMSRKKKQDLGVQWVMPGKKRPFATTTVATNDLIVLMAGDGHTVKSAHDAINYDDEAKAVLQTFIDNGYGATQLDTLVR